MDRNTPQAECDGCYRRQHSPREVRDERYLALAAVASHRPVPGLGLHPARQAALRPVGHRPGPQRRGAHHHPVARRPRPRRTTGRPWSRSPSTAPGTCRPSSGASPAAWTGCPAASGTATASGPATTPRSTATARTSGAPAPSTSTPPAAPTGPAPSAPTTGSSSGRWCPTPASPPASCRSPAGCTSARRSSPPPRTGRRSSSGLKGSDKTYPAKAASSCRMRKQMTLAARVFQASWITPSRS